MLKKSVFQIAFLGFWGGWGGGGGGICIPRLAPISTFIRPILSKGISLRSRFEADNYAAASHLSLSPH